MIINTLHHLPGSGGTIITKLIDDAFKSAVVLSEINPKRLKTNGKWKLHPLTQLEKGYKKISNEAKKSFEVIFKKEIRKVVSICEKRSMKLVLRDHLAQDFIFDDTCESSLLRLLRNDFPINPILTVRDPVDVWLSFQVNDWKISNIDEFLKTYAKVLNNLDYADVLRYEDFVNDTKETLEMVGDIIGSIPNSIGGNVSQRNHFTGDSGRSGTKVRPRPRRRISFYEVYKFRNSSLYSKICDRFDYKKVQYSEATVPFPMSPKRRNSVARPIFLEIRKLLGRATPNIR
jgi:hypothetical protein